MFFWLLCEMSSSFALATEFSVYLSLVFLYLFLLVSFFKLGLTFTTWRSERILSMPFLICLFCKLGFGVSSPKKGLSHSTPALGVFCLKQGTFWGPWFLVWSNFLVKTVRECLLQSHYVSVCESLLRRVAGLVETRSVGCGPHQPAGVAGPLVAGGHGLLFHLFHFLPMLKSLLWWLMISGPWLYLTSAWPFRSPAWPAAGGAASRWDQPHCWGIQSGARRP